MGVLTYGNDLEADWVVQKYGGTSIGKYAVHIAKNIIRETLAQHRVAVVCSAWSTTSKAAGTTTRLIEIFNTLEAGRVRGARPTDNLATLQNSLRVIIYEHIRATAPSLPSKESRDMLAEKLKLEGQYTVSAVAETLFSSDYDYGWAQDLVISLGEKLSCLSMVAILQDLNVEAEYVDLSTILPQSSSATTADELYAELAFVIASRLLACGSPVPVITGFFGLNRGGMLASEIGRGYTDLCAALCAIGLGAAELQIWKEVDGILTADPSRVPSAQLIPHMSFPEVAALTQQGSEVVHALAIRQIMAAAPTGMALCIKNVKHPSAAGTMVVRAAVDKAESSTDSDTDCASLKSCLTFCRAITVKSDVCFLHAPRKTWSCFGRTASTRKGPTVEITATTNTSRKSPTFFLSCAKSLLLGRGKSAHAQSASVITLVCTRAEGCRRLASQVLADLRNESIQSTLLPHADDYGSISCVVPSPDTLRAMTLLHDRFCL
ncbi:uncharacterized protein LMH87_007864 [Akanthomyces muscarius]|uniref:Aspartate/glutamate/uridylate kinase domain-containing protein n=1 Tax=Akanthomyces muscarius TaxID=2231603 RepID=A0A9W8UR28_AKAMU|nr:uncharacterized protein LMH87_007864 [Akanthomyces muscarius]KAJ4159928.1 hypothetical protein LMH87_007864 [Akanthomyces muscarius]